MPTRHKSRRKLKAARVIIHVSHAEMSLVGFEVQDLDDLKEAVEMRWDRYDRVWLIHRLDIDNLIDALKEGGFIVRLRDERD